MLALKYGEFNPKPCRIPIRSHCERYFVSFHSFHRTEKVRRKGKTDTYDTATFLKKLSPVGLGV